MVPESPDPYADLLNAADSAAALVSLRDALRSARRWREVLTEADRRTLLADIGRVVLMVGRDLYPDHSLSELDLGDGEDAVPPTDPPCPRQRVAFLTAVWPRLSRALDALESEPAPALISGTRPVAFARARRVAPGSLLAAVRRGNFVPESGGNALATALGGRLPQHIQETVTLPSWDTPANRAVKTMLTQWTRDLAAASALALQADAPDVAAQAEQLRRRVRVRLRRDPWQTLTEEATVAPLSPSLRTNGPRRLLHENWRRYRRGFVLDWSAPLFSVPARETWLLYEYWCLFQTARVIRSLGFRAVSADEFRLTRGALTVGLAIGRASRIVFRRLSDNRTLTLTYNRTFARAAESDTRTDWHSRSHAMRPDIVIEDDRNRLLILDAKFKTYAVPQWETEDIRQMHGYRDALRHAAGNESRNVQAAWLLYPGRLEAAQARRPVIAFPVATPERPLGNGDVGAILLRPGDANDTSLLFLLLTAFLEP